MSFARRFFIAFIYLYQTLISPWLGVCCRFEPSCSHYAILAIEKHGIIKGGFLTIKRLMRCQPFCSSGDDHVPHMPAK